MIRKRTELSTIQGRLFDVIIAHPEGISLQNIRKELGEDGGNQEQLGRRLRSLKPFYKIKVSHKGMEYVYSIVKEVKKGEYDYEIIDKGLRAKILIIYGQKCQMCGRSPSKDDIILHIDHKLPRNWGGKTKEENLWPLCSACNEGKKDYYSTFDSKIMKKILMIESVHGRIANLLLLKKGEWINSDLLGFVANFNDYQEDWQKRLRELRYFGWKIEVGKQKDERRIISRYKLIRSNPLPKDPSKAARDYESDRAKRNRILK